MTAPSLSPLLLERLDTLLARLVERYEVVYVREPLEQVLGEDEEVTGAQLRTLRFLEQHTLSHPTGAWVGDIASGLAISYPAATKAVDRLFERGLAERFRDDLDARRIRVGLTERGRAVLLEVTRLRLEKLRQALAGLDAEGLARGLEGFERASEG